LPAGGAATRLALPAIAVVAALVFPQVWLAPLITEFKPLPRTLAVAGAEVVAEHSSPYGLLTIVRNEEIPFRHAPGRSLAATTEIPAQLAVFTDGDSMTALTAHDGRESLAWLDQTTSALPYHLLSRPRVLVLGAGGAAEVQQAVYHRAREIHAVELNPAMLALLRSWLDDPRIRLHAGEARGFTRTDDRLYDLVQLAPLGSGGGAGAGVHAAAESYAYTVEAIRDYLARLAPGGYLALTRFVQHPPREGLKLFATAVESLRSLGLDPRNRLALIRGWQTSTLLIKNGPVTAREIAALKAFCEARSFDTAWYPGMPATEANRFNRLESPYFFDAAQAMLRGNAMAFYADYKFDVQPTTDDRPYFSNFFKWSTLPEIFALRAQGGRALLEGGYLVLVVTLAQALVAAFVLIVLPLFFAAGLRGKRMPVSRWRPLVYFASLGLAFLFLEIVFIQKLI
ncbi:MAG: spermidine synthase, partial [Burkholderiales bacterium]